MTVAAKITPLDVAERELASIGRRVSLAPAPERLTTLRNAAEVLQDPQPCELCGCTIEDLEELIYVRAADLIAEWERVDPRDCWRHTGEQPPRVVEPAPAVTQPYRTPQSTIDAFWYVVRLDDPDYLTRWLEQHPLDASALCKLWEGKSAS